MAATDKLPVCYVDLRQYSSAYTLTCATHGVVNSALQFNGDWSRCYCEACFEAFLAATTSIKKLTFAANGAPAPVVGVP